MLEVLQETALGHFLMTLISFIILLAIVYKFAWKPINQILEERQRRVSDDIQSSQADRSEAGKLLKKAEEDRKQARLDINEMVQEGNRKLERGKALALEEAEVEIAQKHKKAEESIEQERKVMLQDMQDQVSKLSVDVAEQILQREVNEEDHKKLLDDLLLEMDADKNDQE